MQHRVAPAVWISFLLLVLTACQSNRNGQIAQFAGGNPITGRDKIAYYGCPACHEISGIKTAKGRVGPSLIHISRQTYLAGELMNTPQNMSLWIQKPKAIEPNTAMPNMGVSDQDARDITAYLYSQK